jgi:hypothetical protein
MAAIVQTINTIYIIMGLEILRQRTATIRKYSLNLRIREATYSGDKFVGMWSLEWTILIITNFFSTPFFIQQINKELSCLQRLIASGWITKHMVHA